MYVPNGQELIDRYTKNYGIPPESGITEDMILEHWELEKQLTRALLNSTPENRWETFDRCYTTLYKKLSWLNQFTSENNMVPPEWRFRDWLFTIGKKPQSIYEIGSGKGELISFLAKNGHTCKGTEITRERGERVLDDAKVSWGISDGVHLDTFEGRGEYDVVISDNVIEHLHPDDLGDHFKGAGSILKKGGRYIFITPHRFIGPSDISRIFNSDRCLGMHLREYTYGELRETLEKSGFEEISAVLFAPNPLKQMLFRYWLTGFGKLIEPRVSKAYLAYLCGLEKLLSAVPGHSLRRKATLASMGLLFNPVIGIVARK